MINVLFLDFDGVLNNGLFLYQRESHLRVFDSTPESKKFDLMKSYIRQENMEIFKKTMDQLPDVKIVISSNWGKYYDLKLLRQLLIYFKISNHVLDITPKKDNFTKMDEILMYMKGNSNIQKALILDDDDVNFNFPEKIMLQTDNLVGFKESDSLKIVQYFTCDSFVMKNEERGIL